MKVLLWAIASHIRRNPAPAPQTGLKVAFITTFVPASEPIGLLKQTLESIIAVRYPHDTWVLDEGNDIAAKELCQELGVKHFSRANIGHYNMPDGKFARKTKGGNHNAWYDAVGHNYDVVAQIDTDFSPRPDFLEKTLGYFRNPKVAFVGTPQIYGNTAQSLIARGAAEQTYNFYGPLLRGMDGMDSTLMIGANHVVRVAALKDIDLYCAHITEDLLTGMKLHSKGWTSTYVPEALAIGEGPATWKAYFNQQKRWAYGCMHILFNHSFNLFSRMSMRRVAYYFCIQQHYFTGLAMLLSIISLVLYFAFGAQFMSLDLVNFLASYIAILVVFWSIELWLQRFNIRPKKERGIMWGAMYVGIAVWPIFLMAFLTLFKRKKLVFKVTPKGRKVKRQPLPYKLFMPHIILGTIALAGFISAFYTKRESLVMLFWAALSGSLLLLVPIIPFMIKVLRYIETNVMHALRSVIGNYKFYEISGDDKGLLPSAPDDTEKYMYARRKTNTLLGFSIISFVCVTLSMTNFLLHHPWLWVLGAVLIINVLYFVVSLVINVGTSEFSVQTHIKLVDRWNPNVYPSVDIFLPNAGEDIAVLRNTWEGVTEMLNAYGGVAKAYCLDDAHQTEVAELAAQFGFQYIARPARGYFKKAGNLRYGFRFSNGDFITIFDADFRPRADFLSETLPYFADQKVGIVQTPQYFSVSKDQNWLERGAGAVQEFFYRFSQVSRQSNDASICVGSNAVYRRAALISAGGTALVEHSEDVHTGFNIRMRGWKLEYVPIILAKGLCPATMPAFFKQQYRWCMGSMSLLVSDKFWNTEMNLRSRLSYISGFLYYVHTALMSIYTPFVPILLLVLMPSEIRFANYFLVLPAFIFTQIIYPLWHKSVYGIEAWATRNVYGWAYLFAIIDHIIDKPMGWQPTGTKIKKDRKYIHFRIMQFLFNFIPAIIWVGFSMYHLAMSKSPEYIPILISGLYYLAVVLKVSFYSTKSLIIRDKPSKRIARSLSVAS